MTVATKIGAIRVFCRAVRARAGGALDRGGPG